MEKKPLYHFYPGETILSLGPNGCNFQCDFCQNWHISQNKVATRAISPNDLVRACVERGAVGIAYTYAEPMIWYEFVLETSGIARQHGLVNVLVTNGFIEREPLLQLLPTIDALNIDIKSMDDDFYITYCRGRLQPVLDTVTAAVGRCHVEITNLVIPGLNDGEDNFRRLALFLANLNPEIPLHFSRYFPHFRMERDPTPPSTLRLAKRIADQSLRFVYLGNVSESVGATTVCPSCGQVLISRFGYQIEIAGLVNGACRGCGREIPIKTAR